MTGTPAAFDVRELAHSQAFVRRLAHSLVFDQQRVDDAIQDAWVAALQQPPRERAAAATWFARVLQNVAHRRARDDARRQRREQVAAVAEALPSADEVMAREQLRRRVVDAVMALPEPYRGTVLARYFDDLTPRAIARRRGVPGATVRSQLARGLELLRARLDADHGGDRRAWSLALLPLARPAAATGMGSLLTLAGVLMTNGVLVGALLALGVFAFFWWDGAAPPAPPLDHGVAVADATPADGLATTVATAANEGAGDARVAVAAPGSAAADAPAFANAALRGRVVRPDGTTQGDQVVRVFALDGARLFADSADEGARPGPLLPRGEARTNADGTFAIAGIWPRVRYVIHADALGPDRTMRVVDGTAEPGEELDLGDVVLTPKGRIVGRVVDGDDRPVAAAELVASDLDAVIATLVPLDRFDARNGGLMTIPAAKSGTDAEEWRSGLRDYLARDLLDDDDIGERDGMQTLVLEHLPWSEQMFDALPMARARTDAEGRFELVGVDCGAAVLFARRPGLRPVTKTVAVRAGERADLGDLVLATGAVLTGTVRDAAGAPVSGAELRIGAIGPLGYRGLAFADAPVFAGKDGAFEVPGLPRGKAMVAVRRAPECAWLTPGPVPTDDDLDIALPAGATLSLDLARADGAACGDARIEVFVGAPLGELRRMGLQRPLPIEAHLRRDGDRVTIAELPPGTVTVRVTAPGCTPAEAIVVLPHADPVAVTLPAAAALAVHVADADGHAVAGAQIYLTRKPPLASDRNVLPTDYGLPRWIAQPIVAGTTDARGDLAVACRPDSDVALVAVHPRLPAASVAIARAQFTAQVTLPRPAAITGRLFDQGRPADTAAWTVVAIGGGVGDLPESTLRRPVAADGSFAFRGLTPGTWRLRAERRSARAVSMHTIVEEVRDAIFSWLRSDPPEHSITVTAGAEATFSFDTDPNRAPADAVATELAGRATMDGRPLAGATIQRRVDPMTLAPLTTVAADGSFASPPVVPGRHQLELEHNGATLWSGAVEAVAGRVTRVDLEFRTGALAGRAVGDAAQWRQAEVRVEGTCLGGRIERYTLLDAAGRFRCDDLPAGEYLVSAISADAAAPAIPVTVAAANTAAVDLAFAPLPRLTGRIDLAGHQGNAMVVARCGTWLHWTPVAADGTFALRQPKRCEVELWVQIAGNEYDVAPAHFDLRQQDQLGVALRITGPRPETDR